MRYDRQRKNASRSNIFVTMSATMNLVGTVVAFRHLRLVTCSPGLSVTCGYLDAVDGKVRKHSKEATRALELVSADA